MESDEQRPSRAGRNARGDGPDGHPPRSWPEYDPGYFHKNVGPNPGRNHLTRLVSDRRGLDVQPAFACAKDLLMRPVLIATSNSGKLRDFAGAARTHGIEVQALPNFSELPIAVE